MSVDSSGNGIRLKKQFAPRYPTAAFWGVLGGQQFKSLGNVVKRLDRLGINFAHIIQVNLGMDCSFGKYSSSATFCRRQVFVRECSLRVNSYFLTPMTFTGVVVLSYQSTENLSVAASSFAPIVSVLTDS